MLLISTSLKFGHLIKSWATFHLLSANAFIGIHEETEQFPNYIAILSKAIFGTELLTIFRTYLYGKQNSIYL